jgi:cold shock CspA family protein
MAVRKIYATSAMGIGGFLIARMEGQVEEGSTSNDNVFVPATAFHPEAVKYATAGAVLIASVKHNPQPDLSRAQYAATDVLVIIPRREPGTESTTRPRDRVHKNVDGSFVATLLWFNDAKGFGFLTLAHPPATYPPTVFIHRHDMQRCGVDNLKASASYEVLLKADTATDKLSVREIRVKE